MNKTSQLREVGAMQLIPILESGTPAAKIGELPVVARDACEFTAQAYKKSGFLPPWTAYLAFEGADCVGTCAFKAAPSDNRVEIAYFTFPPKEGKGVATRMAQKLIELARENRAALIIAAQTLPQENASTSILKKLGFVLRGNIEHPEDGTVWEWQLPPVIVRREPTYLAGVSTLLPPRSSPAEERPRVIRELSRSFLTKVGEIRNRRGGERYSIIENDIEDTGEAPILRTLVAVDFFEGLPSWCERFTLRPGRYAVFEHKGLPKELSKTVANIHTTWSRHISGLFQQSLEVFIYPIGFDPTDPNGTFEYWLPLPASER